MRIRTQLLPLLALMLCAPGVRGQSSVLDGVVIDAANGAPVVGAEVVILSLDFQPVVRGSSDQSGRFRVTIDRELPQYYVYAIGLGYRGYLDGPFSGDEVSRSIAFALPPRALRLDSIEVSTRRTQPRSRRLELAGFYNRQVSDPAAVYLTADDLADKPAVNTYQLFRGIAGVHVSPRRDGIGGWNVQLRNRCFPRVLIDGTEILRLKAGMDVLDDYVSPTEIEGIEIFRSPGEIPTQYAGTGSACGLILVWTK